MKKTLLSVSLAIPVILLAFLGWKAFRTAGRIHIENAGSPETHGDLSPFLPGGEREPLDGEESGRVNILLLGRAGEHYPGRDLTDTVMLASLDIPGHRAAFLSVPRDLFVPIPETGLFTKINSLYQYGLSREEGVGPVIAAVEHITGQDIPYFVTLDFDGFEKVIDDIGGIRIESERDILDTRYPGKNYSYETFALSAGWHTLDGKTALKYARERHDDPEGDFGRAKRQQQIIKAFQEKALSVRTFLDPFTINRLLDTLGDSVRTNLTMGQIASLIELGRTTDLRNASNVVVDAWKSESLLRVSHVDMNGVRAFILVPRTGNWNELTALADAVFDQDSIARKRADMEREAASVLVLSPPEDATDANRFARTVGDAIPGSTVSVVTAPEAKRPEKTAVADRTGLKKPFTLDTLLQTFSLDRTDSAPELPTSDTDPDFVILFGNDLHDDPLPETSLAKESDDSLATDESFSEYFLPTEY